MGRPRPGDWPAARAARAGDVVLVPVPGHSPGQLGVLVEDRDHTVFLAGDSSYTQDLLLRGAVDGVGPDEDAERITHQRIRDYVASNPTVYLVAHDPDTGIRLAERRVIQSVPAELAA